MRKFSEIVQGINRLKAIGIIREDGSVNYPLTFKNFAQSDGPATFRGLNYSSP